MSLFCGFDKSTRRSVVHKIASRPLYTLLSSPATPRTNTRRGLSHTRPSDSAPASPVELEGWFVAALVRAGQCKKHSLKAGISPLSNSVRRTPCLPRHITHRGYASQAAQNQTAGPPISPANSTREELLALVDQYDTEYVTDRLPILELPNLRLHESDSSEFKEDKYSDPDWPPPRYKWPAGQARKAVEALEKALADDRVEPDRLFQLYKALPAPRVPYLDSQRRHVLLRKLALVERKDEESMLRYLSVVDDIKAVGLPLTPHEWNCATSFVGRFVGRITEAEVGASLRMWKEMEHVAGIQANAATFNILFNLATKAGKFELAEMIYEEMRIRGHAFNRYHHVSLIHYHGLRADGDGVRRAYKDLVEAGEIVDTVVLNCMISSLFRAYEPQAAEQVYERMKLLHRRSGMQLPPRDYKKQREVTKSLMRMAEDGRRAPAELTSFKNRSIIAPNIQTYRIMIQSLCVHAGELDKTVMLLDDMRSFGVPLHGSILLALFKGFAIHGGIRYSPWTEDRLGSVWKAVLRAVEDEQDGFYIGKWIVIWALKAYLKCSTKDVALGIWEEAKAKGKLNNDDMDHINNIIRPLMQD